MPKIEITKDWCLSMAKMEDGQEIGAGSKSHPLRQIDIRSASFRVVSDTPGHATYGVWVNGGKCGDLTVRQEERVAFELMMERAGFEKRALREEPPSPKEGVLRMQPSHRWAVCRPGRDPVEITSGEPLRIWMGGRFALTHIEHALGRGYYSVDGYQLVDGMRAAYGSED